MRPKNSVRMKLVMEFKVVLCKTGIKAIIISLGGNIINSGKICRLNYFATFLAVCVFRLKMCASERALPAKKTVLQIKSSHGNVICCSVLANRI